MSFKTKLKYFLDIAADVSDIAIHLRSKPTRFDLACIGVKIASSAIHHYEKITQSPFNKFTPPEEMGVMSDFIFDVCKQNFDMEPETYQNTEYYIFSLPENIIIGFVITEELIYGPYIKNKKMTEFIDFINPYIWDYINTNHALALFTDIGDMFTMRFIKDNFKDIVLPSKKAETLFQRIKQFHNHNINRSMMLYGSSGSGKSSCLKYIISKFQDKCLRLSVSDMEEISTHYIISACKLLKPNILVIDDFDRIPRPDKFLSELELLNSTIKLIMVTVNNIHILDPAVIRPGRFDELVKFEEIDKEIIDQMLKGIPKRQQNILRQMPIAYIDEFHKRKNVLGINEALQELKEFENQAKEIMKHIKDHNIENESSVEFTIETE